MKMRPTRKVSMGVLGTGLTALTFWLVDLKWQVRPPAGVEATASMIFGFIASWIVPEKYQADGERGGEK